MPLWLIDPWLRDDAAGDGLPHFARGRENHDVGVGSRLQHAFVQTVAKVAVLNSSLRGMTIGWKHAVVRAKLKLSRKSIIAGLLTADC